MPGLGPRVRERLHLEQGRLICAFDAISSLYGALLNALLW